MSELQPPHTRILSYVTRNPTPLRIRRIARLGFICAALLYLPVGAVLFTFASFQALHWYSSYDWPESVFAFLRDPFVSYRYFDISDIPRMLYYLPQYVVSYVVLCVMFTSLACLLFAITAPRAGRRTFIVGRIMIFPMIFLLLLSSAYFFCVAGAALLPPFNATENLLYFLPACFLAFVALIGVDLAACLRWIARNPMAEIPIAPFRLHSPELKSPLKP